VQPSFIPRHQSRKVCKRFNFRSKLYHIPDGRPGSSGNTLGKSSAVWVGVDTKHPVLSNGSHRHAQQGCHCGFSHAAFSRQDWHILCPLFEWDANPRIHFLALAHSAGITKVDQVKRHFIDSALQETFRNLTVPTSGVNESVIGQHR